MSALYPTPSPTATAWLATLRATLAELGGEVPAAAGIDEETLVAQLEAEAPEAAELGAELGATIREFRRIIRGLTAAFGIRPATVVIALGRGQALGELDPVVAQAIGQVPELAPLTSSGTVTIEKDGRATTLIAGTTVGPPVGPVRVRWPDREDVWLCAVPAAEPFSAARAALERILPHVGVPRARISAGSPAHTLHAALLTVDPAADPDLVMARLEGWRTAVEQLHRGAVAIHWEQA
ncbi:MAG: hypothetical protein HOV83_23265 [Catenulispora sp.]|nr:hypothetical protein [Catenulispora sp.]